MHLPAFTGRARGATLLVLLLAAGCGAPDPAHEFDLHGAVIRVETDAPFAQQETFPARAETVIAVALAYWGGSWNDLRGRTVTVSAGPYVACKGTARASGCFDGHIRVASWDPGVGTVRCLEQTVLVHEIGHAVLGDAMHTDRRWMELEPVAEELAGGVGWGPDGASTCAISVNVWRHPLDAP